MCEPFHSGEERSEKNAKSGGIRYNRERIHRKEESAWQTAEIAQW
jgi:hypothetical protein